MKCPRCQQENPPPGNFCSRCGEPFGAAVVAGPPYAQLRAENEELRRSLGAAIEQQTATAEILRVISSSPTDVQPVFDAIVRSAVRLCDGRYGFVGRFDGEQIHIAAHHNYAADALRVMQEMYPMRPSRQQVSGRVILTRSVVQSRTWRRTPSTRSASPGPAAGARRSAYRCSGKATPSG